MADRFMKGTLILTAAGLMVKILGSVNRILLSRLLGGEGIGLYQIAYPLYLLLVALSSAGIPAAMSILISRRAAAGDRQGARRILGISAGLMALAGVFFAALAWALIPWLMDGGIVKDGRARYAMLALVPAIGLSIPVACFRGYFQGFQEMTPTAVSQILEQFTRVVTMVLLAWALLPWGLPWGAAGAAFGAVPGAVVSLGALLYFVHRQQKRWQQEPVPALSEERPSLTRTAWQLVSLALPVTCANLMVPVVSGIEMILVPDRLLAAGFTVADSTRALGYLSGMAMPLVNMGTIPTNSLAASVVPAVAEAKALGDRPLMVSKTRRAFRFFLLLNVPAAVGVYLLGTPISQVLYGTIHAGRAITALAPAILFLGLHQVSTAILQGLGHTRVPMVNMFLSLFVKVGLLWTLTANPVWNIQGAAWATDANLAVAGLGNLLWMHHSDGLTLPGKNCLRIGVSAALMGAALWALGPVLARLPLGNVVRLALEILAGALVYGLCLLATGELKLRELKRKKEGKR
ncbi:polysaccharide biosynthesis protein [Acidaminococcus fermentans]|uniref:putative polysaccharide biosynthesis protein n=1 Tax=Acidaminococcus fermentans TaxID=905 RepID=UPI002431D31F|nr:polysaccharide biosynthesis protein [Acidaminococcus fermentans]